MAHNHLINQRGPHSNSYILANVPTRFRIWIFSFEDNLLNFASFNSNVSKSIISHILLSSKSWYTYCFINSGLSIFISLDWNFTSEGVNLSPILILSHISSIFLLWPSTTALKYLNSGALSANSIILSILVISSLISLLYCQAELSKNIALPESLDILYSFMISHIADFWKLVIHLLPTCIENVPFNWGLTLINQVFHITNGSKWCQALLSFQSQRHIHLLSQ